MRNAGVITLLWPPIVDGAEEARTEAVTLARMREPDLFLTVSLSVPWQCQTPEPADAGDVNIAHGE
ncbi:MAG: hypothetical protein ACKV2V_21565, partial [Blastocatellia bacterium]